MKRNITYITVLTFLLLSNAVNVFARVYPDVITTHSAVAKSPSTQSTITYPIVDTGQTVCYNNSAAISAPSSGSDFYGQDAQYNGNQPSYTDNGDGTVTDNVTGLMWQKGLPEGKYSQSVCQTYADTCTLAGYTDWRLPTIQELYSLILFSGKTMMTEDQCIPYIDTDAFDFRFGGTVISDERIIDAQYATSTIYKGTTMGGNVTMFGVNFVDGRIKGYPVNKDFEVKVVRGRSDYGTNDFSDNNDGTITDLATGLMWDQAGSSEGMGWKEAFAWTQKKNSENYLGHNDWRLPNAKELQSIVDYERSLSYTNSAAISPLFNVPVIVDEGGGANYPFYWASTTHCDGPYPDRGVYVCFGEALGWMQDFSGNYILQDVHGAGAQRSDPKIGDPDDYPYGNGPQGDVIRIYNYVRLVRDADLNTTTPVEFGTLEGTYLPDDNTVQLAWDTYSESRNYGFEIERKNGDWWEVLDFVSGGNTISEHVQYEYTDVLVNSDTQLSAYQYRLKQIDLDGSYTFTDEITVQIAMPTEYQLAQNYPNPFNPQTTIRFYLPCQERVKLVIFNTNGRQVASLINDEMPGGWHDIQWQASDLSSGTYFYTLTSGAFAETKRMILLK